MKSENRILSFHFLVILFHTSCFLVVNRDESFLFSQYQNEKGKSHEGGASMLFLFFI